MREGVKEGRREEIDEREKDAREGGRRERCIGGPIDSNSKHSCLPSVSSNKKQAAVFQSFKKFERIQHKLNSLDLENWHFMC